jgi:hypothetical protein
MVWVSEDFFRKQDKEDRFSLEYDVIKTYSLLDPRLNWKLKAVSSVCSLSAEEVNKIHKWKSKTQLHRFRTIDKTSINDSGWFNLGHFKTNTHKNRYESISLGTDAKYINGCEVYLYAIAGGTYYLSMYWFLTDEATLLVKDIDVSGFNNRTIKHFTCNPFNSIYGSSTYKDKFNFAEEALRDGIDTIFNEINLLEKKLKKILSIKSCQKSVKNLDVIVKEDVSYFYDEKDFKNIIEEKKKKKPDVRFRLDEVFINRAPPFITSFINRTEKEFLLGELTISDFPFNNIFIKSEKLTEQQKKDVFYGTYESMPCHIQDSHNMFAIHQLIVQNLNEINDNYVDYILGDDFDTDEHYDKLYRAYIEIEELEKKIKGILSERSKSRFGYRKSGDCSSIFFSDCSYALDRVSEIKTNIRQRKQNSNELVQSGNLKYQKRNAQLVVFLVIIQIVLAYLTLDDEMIKKLITPVNLRMYFFVILVCFLYKPCKYFYRKMKKRFF